MATRIGAGGHTACVVDGHVAIGVGEDAVGIARGRRMDVAGAAIGDRDGAQVGLGGDAVGAVVAGRIDGPGVGDDDIARHRIPGDADRGAVFGAGVDVP